MRRITKRPAVVLAVLLALVLWAPYASASETEPAASITIHKLLTDTGKELGRIQDGEEITNPDEYRVYEGDSGTTLRDLKGINGISFTVTRVQDSLKNMEDARPFTGQGAYQKMLVTQNRGGESGIAFFEDLPHGTYLVEEVRSAGYDGDNMKFLVQVPMPSPRDGRLIHDIHIYPKNTRRSSLKKEVAQFSEHTPDKVTWRFRWEIPEGIDGARGLVLTDPLDDRLTLRPGASAVSVKYSNRAGATRTLHSRYYQVEYDKRENVVTVIIDDTDAFGELAKANLPDRGAKSPLLSIEITTAIAADAKGTIYNTGELDYEDGEGKPHRLLPERDPSIYIGDIGGLLIYKYDGDTGKPLSGAQFELYETEQDALERTNAIENPRNSSGNWPATGTDGYALLDGIAYEGNGTSFWLVESVAPVVAGSDPPQFYNILPGPVEVTVNPSSHRKGNQVEVENRRGIPLDEIPIASGPGVGNTGARVPDGGGGGTLPWRLGGSALLAVGAALAARRYKNRASAQK